MQGCVNSLSIENTALTLQFHVAAVRKENVIVVKDYDIRYAIYHSFLPLSVYRITVLLFN